MNFNPVGEEFSNSLGRLGWGQNTPECLAVGYERELRMRPSSSSPFHSIWGGGNGLGRGRVEAVDIPRRNPAPPGFPGLVTPGSSMSSDLSPRSRRNTWWDDWSECSSSMFQDASPTSGTSPFSMESSPVHSPHSSPSNGRVLWSEGTSGPSSSPMSGVSPASGTSLFSMESSPLPGPSFRRVLENEAGRSGHSVEGPSGWLGPTPPLSFPASGSSSSFFFDHPGQPMMHESFSPPQQRLFIVPAKSVNFAKCKVRFTVQATNLPEGIPLNAYLVTGKVVTPQGNRIPCVLREVIKTNMFEMDEFSGWFWSTSEVGRYYLKVRFSLPWPMVDIVEDTAILVLRNYVNESWSDWTLGSSPPISYQAEFQPCPGNKWGSRKYGDPDEDDESSVVSKIWGIDCDTLTNRLYYTDRAGNSLSCVDAERDQVIFKMSPSNSPILTQLDHPTGICCDMVHRRLIVADKDHHRICFFSTNGQYLTSFGGAGHGQGTFKYPWDVAVSPDGSRIAVTDSRNRRLQLFDTIGQFLGSFSIYEESPFEYSNFEYPRGVTFSRDGTFIYVSDFNTHNILEIPLDLKSYRRILPEGVLRRPQGLAVDSLDSLLICDSKNHAIRHVWPFDGRRLSQIRNIGGEKLELPVDLAVMGDDRLAVIDSQAKIHIF